MLKQLVMLLPFTSAFSFSSLNDHKNDAPINATSTQESAHSDEDSWSNAESSDTILFKGSLFSAQRQISSFYGGQVWVTIDNARNWNIVNGISNPQDDKGYMKFYEAYDQVNNKEHLFVFSYPESQDSYHLFEITGDSATGFSGQEINGAVANFTFDASFKVYSLYYQKNNGVNNLFICTNKGVASTDASAIAWPNDQWKTWGDFNPQASAGWLTSYSNSLNNVFGFLQTIDGGFQIINMHDNGSSIDTYQFTNNLSAIGVNKFSQISDIHIGEANNYLYFIANNRLAYSTDWIVTDSPTTHSIDFKFIGDGSSTFISSSYDDVNKYFYIDTTDGVKYWDLITSTATNLYADNIRSYVKIWSLNGKLVYLASNVNVAHFYFLKDDVNYFGDETDETYYKGNDLYAWTNLKMAFASNNSGSEITNIKITYKGDESHPDNPYNASNNKPFIYNFRTSSIDQEITVEKDYKNGDKVENKIFIYHNDNFNWTNISALSDKYDANINGVKTTVYVADTTWNNFDITVVDIDNVDTSKSKIFTMDKYGIVTDTHALLDNKIIYSIEQGDNQGYKIYLKLKTGQEMSYIFQTGSEKIFDSWNPSPEPTPSPDKNKNDITQLLSVILGIGLGVGIPLAGLITFTVIKFRRIKLEKHLNNN